MLKIRMALILVGLATGAYSEESKNDARIAEALLPLPQALRADATVVTYDAEWAREILREGENGIVCVADGPQPGFSVICQHESMEAFWMRGVQLRAEGKTQRESNDIRIEEIEKGKLPRPEPGAARYILAGTAPETALGIMVVMIPYATTESTGLSTEPDNYRPWLMDAGTIAAHIMVPGQ